MQSFVSTWNTLMAFGTVGLMIFSLVCLYSLFVKTNQAIEIKNFIRKNILWIGFFITGMSVVSSLVYSEVIGYPPCMFCWYARIFFYPQLVLFIVALKKKDLGILNYSLPLTIIGVIISTYHYIIETIGYSPLPCSASGVSCTVRYVYEWGFISIPFMALMGFTALMLSILVAKKSLKQNI